MKRLAAPAALLAALAITACSTQEGLSPDPKAVPPGDPILSPIEQLKPDTAEAALTDSALFGQPYSGVWSVEPGGCRLIDVSPEYQSFAVITVKTLRLGQSSCAIAPKAPGEPIDALCGAAGATKPQSYVFTPGPDGTLTIADQASQASSRYVRCRLP